MHERPRTSREPFPDWAPTLLAVLLASFVVAVLSACADSPSPAVAGSQGATVSQEFVPGAWIASAPDGTRVAAAVARSHGAADSRELTPEAWIAPVPDGASE